MKYLLHINSTYNNTILNLTNKKGETIIWSTAGSSKFKGKKKSTPYAAQVSTEKIINFFKKNNINKTSVICKGPGAGRDSVLRTLNNFGIEVVSILDTTSIPHNGCRPPKKRRI
ncbi:30S ribosomal protein S11 [Candidatus Vidania fulgoroideorum]